MKKLITITCIFFLTLFSIFAQKGQEVTIDLNKGKLSGTHLEVPETSLVALIIAGSGPTDRDGNNPAMKNNSLKMLAEGLAEEGISSVRIDKRGVGGSASAAVAEDQLTFDTLMADVNKWIDYLTTNLGYESVVLIGHSQGSLLSILAARQNPAVNGLISIAGASRPVDAIIEDQIAKQAPVLSDETAAILDSLRIGEPVKRVNPMLMTIFRPSVQPFLISYMEYDPRIEISKLDIPVLLINGDLDIQVEVTEAQALAEKSKNSKLVIIKGMNHVMKTSPEYMGGNIATYNNPELPLVESLVPEIISFINNLN